jgi:hypothetical protein
MPIYNTDTPEVNFEFKYPVEDDPIFSELRNIADIKLSPTTTELEQCKTVIGYAHNLFAHNGDNEPSSFDPLTIIKEAKAGKSFRCVEYSLLATALLWAYGVPSRMIGLKTSDVETREYGAGHVVIEFWSRERQKWIMCDVQAGIILKADDALLSAFELGQKINQKQPLDYVLVDHSRFIAGPYDNKPSYVEWVGEYLYFFDTPIETIFAPIDKRKEQIAMLVPLNVAPPKMFQGMFKMNAVYTHSVIDFYPAFKAA